MTIINLVNATKTIQTGSNEEKCLLDTMNLTINEGDFITVLGGNGAGKSTLFNVLSGVVPLSSGKIFLRGNEITKDSEEKRASYLSRVFQDPKIGTAPRMTVAENLLLAQYRGLKRGVRLRQLENEKKRYYSICQEVGNGLENHLDTPTGNLSGGQRQALSLLMATLRKPDVLLLDEHTAALDPKTSKQLMYLTEKKVKESQLTCLMITHRMEDALKYGNRMLVLQNGKVMKDFTKAEKDALTMSDLLAFFEEVY